MTVPASAQVIVSPSGGQVIISAAGLPGPAGEGGGTVTEVSVESANGFAGTVADATTTPQITLETTVSGVLKGSGGAIEAAAAGTDYLAPSGSGAALTGITAAQVGADASGSAATAQANAETYAAAQASAAQSAAESYAASQASAVQSAAESFATSAVATETSRAETAEALKAPLASPALTGSPTAPTAAALTDSTQIATTAYADSAVGVETARAEAAEALKAPLASPALTGTPTAPTASASDDSTKLATTAFVATAGATTLASAETYAAAQASAALASAETYAVPKGATIYVAQPTGLTATDTPNVVSAISNFVSALSYGPCTLRFADGTYQIDSNSAVIRSVSNFAVSSLGGTVIEQAPNRSGLPNNVTGDLFVIADCTDFRVEGITFDGMRDTVAPLTPLTASASSGQPSVTVASGQGANYQVGQYLCIFGGLGTSDQNKSDGFAVGAGAAGREIQSITPGAGTAGGDLITFTANLANSYSQISSTLVSDGFGPYACDGAYLTPYQAAPASSVAGRSLSGEDQQCGLHLISCQRFTVTRCESRNVWESPFKLGTGFASTSLTDGCAQGTVAECAGYHGYDQGVSIWVGNHVSVVGNVLNAAGWAGICMTASDVCTVTSNQVLSSYYQVPGGLGEGSGIVTEGGVRNQIAKNIISNVYQTGIKIDASPLYWGLPNTKPSLTSYLAAQTAAGTSIQVSSTTGIEAGGLYSWLDGERSEAVTVQSVVDGTHVTLTQPVLFSHPAGTYLVERIAQENVVEGNTIYGAQTGNGISAQGGVRTVIKNNVIANWSLTSGANGNGIVLDYQSTGVPAGTYLGGYGTHIEGNVIGGGYAAGIRATWVGGLLIRGNNVYGGYTSAAAILLNGIYDSAVEGNRVHDVEGGQGILLATGGPSSVPCARTTVEGNDVNSTSGEGILVLSGSSAAADSLIIKGNKVSSCGGHAGINLRGVTNSQVEGNVSNSNVSDGIRLENNGSVYCLYNRVTGNTARDDGSGVNVTTGVAQTQQYGIREIGNSNFNVYAFNECDSNGNTQLATVGANSYAFLNTISNAVTGDVPAAFIPQLASYAPTGLTGATASSAYGGATASGAPATGTWALGSFVVDQTGGFWVCTTAGTPGTWTQCSGSGGSLTNPMTSLGDTLYGGSSGAATRLAGNATAVSLPLVSKGNGSAAAAPAWNPLPGQYLCPPSSYAPTSQQVLATTSATVSAVTGAASTVAAGSNGGEISQIATWGGTYGGNGVLDVANGTVFPAGGGTVNVAASGATTAVVTYTGVSGNTLTGCAYVSGSATGTVSTGGAVTLTSAVASTGSFTAPPSGEVVVTVWCVSAVGTTNTGYCFGLLGHGTSTLYGNLVTWLDGTIGVRRPWSLVFPVTGLTPGSSYDFDLAYAIAGSATLDVYAYAQATTSPTLGSGQNGSPVTMTVQAM